MQQEVNNHGSIFRPVHQESDVGIDAFIEYVESEEATGQLVAVQVKSGDSYLNKRKDKFVLPIDKNHLQYWNDFALPVIIVFYSPSLNKSAFVEVKSYIKLEEYRGSIPIKKIEANLESRKFDSSVIGNQFKAIIRTYKDEKILFDSVERCLSDDIASQKQGFLILSNHPFSRGRKIVLYIASNLVTSSDVELAKASLYTLGYGVGRLRWSFNPNNEEESDVSNYASKLCHSFSNNEIKGIVCLVKGEYWSGPDGLGERIIDIINCNEEYLIAIDEILDDKSQDVEVRAFCLYVIYNLDEELIINSKEYLYGIGLKNVYDWFVN